MAKKKDGDVAVAEEIQSAVTEGAAESAEADAAVEDIQSAVTEGTVEAGEADAAIEEEVAQGAEPVLPQKEKDFAIHMLAVYPGVEAVYVVGGRFYTDKLRAEGRSRHKGGYVHVVKRSP